MKMFLTLFLLYVCNLLFFKTDLKYESENINVCDSWRGL